MIDRLGFNEGPLKRTKFGNEPVDLYFPDKGNVHFKSKLEGNWALYLQFLKEQKHIIEWQYEPEILTFEGETQAPVRWIPDFYVTELDESETIHECKGKMTGQVNSKARKCRARWDNDLWLIFSSIPTKSAANMNNARKHFARIVGADKEIFRGLRGLINFV